MCHVTSWLRRRLGAARSFQKSHVRVVEGDEIIPCRVARLFIRFFFVVEIKLTREVTFKNLSIQEKCIHAACESLTPPWDYFGRSVPISHN